MIIYRGITLFIISAVILAVWILSRLIFGNYINQLKVNYTNQETYICNTTEPEFSNLQFDNIYWQTLNTTNDQIKLFRAFYDDRMISQLQISPSIRIIAMLKRTEVPNFIIYCQLWRDNSEIPIISEIIEYSMIWMHTWALFDNYVPFLITCPYNFNKYHKIPQGVSLVREKCDQAENYLKVLNYRPNLDACKKPLAVCVKPLNYVDEAMSIRLVEWIELQRILGVEKIYMYEFNITKSMRKVLDYYENYGIVEVVKLLYPKNLPIDRLPNEVISLNDCFYRNMYLYDYIAIIDIDEVIMPSHPKDMSLIDMMKSIGEALPENIVFASYNFRNVYFLDELQHTDDFDSDIPHYLHILQNFVRLKYHDGSMSRIKSFHNTNLVQTVHNHFPIACLNGECQNLDVNTDFGHLTHYRLCPPNLKKACKEYQNYTVEDKTVWKYKDELIKHATKAINMLELIKKN